MKPIRKLILIVVLLGTSVLAKADSFKDLFESLAGNDRFNNLMNLKDYQAQNPDQAITYYLLGEILNEYMLEVDPLLMFDALEMDYDRARVYYNLAKFKLDEKQARQDREYFGEVEMITDKKKAGLPDILNKIEEHNKQLTTYYQKAKTLHDNYFRFIDKYNTCLFKYRDILSKYPNYKELYLLASPKLIDEIANMALNFDSSLVFFQNYVKSSKDFTHLINVNTYKLKPITTYRLEGLVESDFTAEEVPLWNYQAWAENFLALFHADIDLIRTKLPETVNALQKNIERLNSSTIYSDDIDHYIVDLKFQNLIGKYDHASLSNRLINYEKNKLDYMLQTHAQVNDIHDSLQFYLINKLRFFNDLARTKVSLNEEASELKQATTFEDVMKYMDFFDEQFNGMDGFTRWCEVEKYLNDEIFNRNLDNLNTFYLKDRHQYDFTDSLIVYDHLKIPLGRQYPDSASARKDTVYTTAYLPYKKSVFQYGTIVGKDSVVQAYVSRISRKGKIEWFRKPTAKEKTKVVESEITGFQFTYDSLLYVVSHTVYQENDTTEVEKTRLNRLNWNGELETLFEFESQLKPVYFYLDEINEQVLIMEYGFDASIDSNRNTLSAKLFTLSDSLLWTQHFQLSGNFVEVTQTNSNFLISCNYSDFQYKDKAIQTKDGRSGVVSIYLARDGQVTQINTYELGTGIAINYSEKIADNTINFFGKASKSDNKQNYFYLLVNNTGEPQFCNLKDLLSRKYVFN